MKKHGFIKQASSAVVCALIYVVCRFLLPWKHAAIMLVQTLALIWLVFFALSLLMQLLMNINKMKTVASMMTSIAKYAAVIVSVFWGLSVLGVNSTGILAAAGVVTIVIGFGAQSLIEDVLTGVFLLFEGQYHIGDILVIGDFRGRVIDIGVRTTVLEDRGGNRKVINNSDIRDFQNRSQNNSVAVCEIAVYYDEPLEKLEELFRNELPLIGNNVPELFLSAPKYCGIQSFEDSGVLLRFTVCVTEENIFNGQRELNRQLKLLFDRNGIRIPFPQIVVHRAD